MTCARCGSRITAGQPCDYHERGCDNIHGQGVCRCDTSQPVHRSCCERCTPSVRISA